MRHLWQVVDLLFSQPRLLVLQGEDFHCHVVRQKLCLPHTAKPATGPQLNQLHLVQVQGHFRGRGNIAWLHSGQLLVSSVQAASVALSQTQGYLFTLNSNHHDQSCYKTTPHENITNNHKI